MKETLQGLVALVGVSLLVAGCGGGSDGNEAASAAATTGTTVADASSAPAAQVPPASGGTAAPAPAVAPAATQWTGADSPPGGSIKRMNLAWNASVGADGYQLVRDPDGDGLLPPEVFGDTLRTLSTTVHLGLLADEERAVYRVRACNAAGCSPLSTGGIGPVVNNLIGYFKAGNPAWNARFGESVALSADGTTMVVGAPGEASGTQDPADTSALFAGAVYVFRRTDTGSGWQQEAYLKSDQPQANAFFGHAVTITADGNTLVVGAPGEPDRGTYQEKGAAHVFSRVNGAWTRQARLTTPRMGLGNIADSLAVSADGRTLAVGAAGTQSIPFGAVHVFGNPGGTWTLEDTIRPSGLQAGDAFGYAIALSADGNTLAAGVPGLFGTLGGAHTESAFVYVRSNGLWRFEHEFTADVRDANGDFGRSVALSGDGGTLAVGAVGESSFTGAAYVFTRSGSTWTRELRLVPDGAANGDLFGWKVSFAADGRTLAVGAIGEDGDGKGVNPPTGAPTALSSGAAHVFRRNGTAWPKLAYLKAPNARAGAAFGWSLVLSSDGRSLAIGAHAEDGAGAGVQAERDSTGLYSAGAVYLF